MGEIIRGKKILEKLQHASGTNVSSYNYHEYVINASSLIKGIKYYDIALRIFMGAVLKRHKLEMPKSTVGTGNWIDLSGLLLPESEELQLIEDIKNGSIENINQVIDRFVIINANYPEYRWTWAYRMILDYYHLETLNEQTAAQIHMDYVKARRTWIAEIRKDAEKEFSQGDVDEELLENFLSQLDKEVEYEDQGLF